MMCSMQKEEESEVREWRGDSIYFNEYAQYFNGILDTKRKVIAQELLSTAFFMLVGKV